jgi:D-glycero-D-manno-heptose 1,7-bisphosphate phosphatase
MKAFLLDRDGVLVVNRPTNIKAPGEIALIPGAAEAIGRLTAAGFKVGICTNQPEIGRGVASAADIEQVHRGLKDMVAAQGGRIDLIQCCGAVSKSPHRKPAAGMLREALEAFGADPASTWFVGDQKDDLQAAFHARCHGVLVKTGMGLKTLARGLPSYVLPVPVFDDLASVAAAILE